MKKCSRALKERVIEYTQTIFNDCISEIFEVDPEDADAMLDASFTVRLINKGMAPTHENPFGTYEELLEKRDKIEVLYQVKVRQLTTKQLNEILKAHNLEDGLRRAPKTVETIISELARRAILDDSGESDLIHADGDVDESKSKSRKHSKKATSKRRKTSKSR